MKKRFLTVALACACITLAAASGVGAQTFLEETTWSVDGGLSLPTGDAADAANLGFCLGFNGFYQYNEYLHFGMRLAYNRWGADEEEWESAGFAADIDGHWSSIEIVPQVRYMIKPDEMRPMNFFGQAGIGIYRIASDVEISYKSGPITSITAEEDEFELGLCLGGGITMERGNYKYEIRPMYHIAFTEGDAFTYFVVTGGVAF